jgi:beta-glucanase (GH16 family)
MKNNTLFQIIFSFFLLSQFCFAQVGVVYKDLVWFDEFDGSGPINSTNWFHQTQLPSGGSWYNNEVQHYTNQSANSFVSAGFLNIVAKKGSYTNQNVTKQYTSARLNSKFSFKYGRVEVRAKLPIGAGTWPAIWMLGKNIKESGAYFASTHGTTSWPACGEVDIMEHWGTNQNYVQSAMHTPSSYGGTVNLGGQTIATASSEFHIYSLDWTAEKMVFSVDNVVHYTYNPKDKNADTWPFDAEQYILLNVAIQSNIISNFTQSAMEVDYVRVYQNTTPDNEPPTNFTASVGTISGSSVELVLNALDNSGNVTYNVDYGTGTKSTFSLSGVQKSLVISDLSPNTNYTFTVTATDASGKTTLNNSIVLKAKTTTIIQCSGTSASALEGSFSLGYNYTFETAGTDVKITFELLDTNRVGVVAFLRNGSAASFTETSMTNFPANTAIFSKTITGQTVGSTINCAVKFAYANGMSVTKYFPYKVGSNCSLGIENPLELKSIVYPNPVHNTLFLELKEYKNRIVLTDVLGRKLFDGTVPTNYSLDMSSYKAGLYFLRVENTAGVQELKVVKE